MNKVQFDIQKVVLTDHQVRYEVFYKVNKEYRKITDMQFETMKEAKKFIDEIVEENS